MVSTGQTPNGRLKTANVAGGAAKARACGAPHVLLSRMLLTAMLLPGLMGAAAPPGGSAAGGSAAAGSAAGGTAAGESAPTAADAARPLDLALGELRSFMAPRDWFTPLPAEIDEVIVRGRRKPTEIPDRKQVPPGLGGLFWGARNPTEAWRLLVPDPNVKVPPRDPDAPQEPPGAYRTRIGEPGKIF